jgi:hypothetical protein
MERLAAGSFVGERNPHACRLRPLASRIADTFAAMSATCQPLASKGVRASPAERAVTGLLKPFCPVGGTVVDYGFGLDKLGVTGSSPVPPITEVAGNGGFRFQAVQRATARVRKKSAGARGGRLFARRPAVYA